MDGGGGGEDRVCLVNAHAQAGYTVVADSVSVPPVQKRRRSPAMLKGTEIMSAIQHHPTMSAAAKHLGVHRSQLSRAFKKYNNGILFSSLQKGGKACKPHSGTGQYRIQLVLTFPCMISPCGSHARSTHISMSEFGELFSYNAEHALGKLHPRFVALLVQRQFEGAIMMTESSICHHMQEHWGNETEMEKAMWASTRDRIAQNSIALLECVGNAENSSPILRESVVYSKIIVCIMKFPAMTSSVCDGGLGTFPNIQINTNVNGDAEAGGESAPGQVGDADDAPQVEAEDGEVGGVEEEEVGGGGGFLSFEAIGTEWCCDTPLSS